MIGRGGDLLISDVVCVATTIFLSLITDSLGKTTNQKVDKQYPNSGTYAEDEKHDPQDPRVIVFLGSVWRHPQSAVRAGRRIRLHVAGTMRTLPVLSIHGRFFEAHK